MTLYLKGHQKYDRSKLKVQLLLSKFRLFNFDLSYLLYPLRYKVTQYLIRKLSDMVKMGIEGLAVAALLINISQGISQIEDLLHKQGLVETQLLRTVFVLQN